MSTHLHGVYIYIYTHTVIFKKKLLVNFEKEAKEWKKKFKTKVSMVWEVFY